MKKVEYSGGKSITVELKQSLALTDAVLNSVHNGILVVGHQGEVLKTNAKFAELWHIPHNLIEQGDDKKLLDFVLGQLANPDEFVAKVS